MRAGPSKSRKVAVTIGVVIAVLILVIILLCLLFKPQHPVTSVESTKLKDMDMGMDMFKMRMNLNVTLGVQVSVKNPNRFGFKYSNTSTQLNYRGQQIGEVPIPSGQISPGQTKAMRLTLRVMADRFLSDPQASSDVMSGKLPLNTTMKITGQVSILGFIHFQVGSLSSCDFAINMTNRTIVDNKCHYETKI